MSYNIFYILGVLFVLYLFIGLYNKKHARQRKSRRFMEGYERKTQKRHKDEKKSDKEPGA